MKLLVPNYKIDPMFQHPEYPWYIGSPDALVIADDHKSGDFPIGGVDFKTTSSSYISDWGEAGTDEVPPYYHTQAMWYMGLTNAQWWDIAVLFLGSRREFRIYRVMRDDELIASLIAKGKEFWEQHVKLAIPPDVDASPGWGKYFKKEYPKEEEDVIDADFHLEELMTIYKGYQKQAKDIDDKWAEVENILKLKIGNHVGITGQFGKVTWKKSRDRVVTDWEQAFNYVYENYVNEFNDDWEAKDEILKKFTTTHQGPRVFKTYWKKEQD